MGSPTKRSASKRVARPQVARWTPSVAGEPKLMHVLGQDADGNDITRADKIIAYLRTNASLAAAAAAAGVPRRTLTSWQREGIDAMTKAETIRSGNGHGLKLTKRDRILIDFVERVDQAIAESHVRAAGALTRLAEGVALDTTVEKVERHHTADGEVIERVIERKTTRATAVPSLGALELILSRRFKDEWARTDTVRVEASGTVAITADQLAPTLNKLAAKIATRALAAQAAADAAAEDVVDAEVIDDDGGEPAAPPV